MFTPRASDTGLILMVIISLAMMTLTLIEKPWKYSETQILAVVNDQLVYLVFVLALVSSSLTDVGTSANTYFGWTLIWIITLAIHVNLVGMAANAFWHLKLIYTRY